MPCCFHMPGSVAMVPVVHEDGQRHTQSCGNKRASAASGTTGNPPEAELGGVHALPEAAAAAVQPGSKASSSTRPSGCCGEEQPHRSGRQQPSPKRARRARVVADSPEVVQAALAQGAVVLNSKPANGAERHACQVSRVVVLNSKPENDAECHTCQVSHAVGSRWQEAPSV